MEFVLEKGIKTNPKCSWERKKKKRQDFAVSDRHYLSLFIRRFYICGSAAPNPCLIPSYNLKSKAEGSEDKI